MSIHQPERKVVKVMLDDTTQSETFVLYPCHVYDIARDEVIPNVVKVEIEITQSYGLPPATGRLIVQDQYGLTVVPVEIYFDLKSRDDGSLV